MCKYLKYAAGMTIAFVAGLAATYIYDEIQVNKLLKTIGEDEEEDEPNDFYEQLSEEFDREYTELTN